MITPLDVLSLETWILIISVFVLMRFYVKKKWRVLKDLNIPHDPPSLLGLGNLGDLFKDPDAFFKLDLERKKKFGLIYGAYTLFQPRICISDPEIMKQIYIKEATTFRDRQKILSKAMGKEMNTGLTAASGDQWKRIRNTLSPTFSTTKLKNMIGLIDHCTDKMITCLRNISKIENGEFVAKDVFGRLSMDVICSAAFSTNVHAQDGKETELVKQAKLLFSETFFKSPVVFFLMLFPWAERVAEKLNYSVFPKQFLNYFCKLTEAIIQNQNNPTHKQQRMDIMQHMLENEISEEDVKNGAVKGLTRTEIVGNSMLMIMAGYETTANTILLFAYCLATSRENQEKLREEIDHSVEKNNGLTYEGINDMKFLDMCMKESQRLYGVAVRNSRYAEKDITVNGIQIPAGTHVDFPLYGMSHDEEYWDEPWEYKPERFEDMSKIDPMVFQPFGAGPRNCIGMRFAITEVKMTICKLIKNFDLGVCDKTPAAPLDVMFRGGSMQPKESVYLKVTPRQSLDGQESSVA